MEPRTDSKRWNTTTGTALIETAIAIKNIDRGSLVEELRLRKIHNSKSSINFGNAKVTFKLFNFQMQNKHI